MYINGGGERPELPCPFSLLGGFEVPDTHESQLRKLLRVS